MGSQTIAIDLGKSEPDFQLGGKRGPMAGGAKEREVYPTGESLRANEQDDDRKMHRWGNHMGAFMLGLQISCRLSQ